MVQVEVSNTYIDMNVNNGSENEQEKTLRAIGLLPGGSGYFTCKQNMKLVITKFKSGELYENNTYHIHTSPLVDYCNLDKSNHEEELAMVYI